MNAFSITRRGLAQEAGRSALARPDRTFPTMKKAWFALLTVVAYFGGWPIPLAHAEPIAIVTLEQGDGFEGLFQTKAALAVYLKLEQGGRKDAELLWRIALEYSELMPDTVLRPEKQRLGEISLGYAQRAVAADCQNARAYLALSMSYGRLAILQDNRTKLEYSREVRANAEIALRLDPQLDYADYVLGVWNYELANLGLVQRGFARLVYGGLPDASDEKAVEYLQKAIALAPQRVSHHIELGRAYAAMGRNDLARDELECGLALKTMVKDDEAMKRKGRAALLTLPPRSALVRR
jgi:tetratricopeptide (TPR) repeat protein